MTTTTINPVESAASREAIGMAYYALRAIASNTGEDFAKDLADEAMGDLEARMSPNLLVTVLPSYSRVRFATDRSREGQTQEGIVRDGAWGMFPERTDSAERRITTNGWEFFVTPDTVFTYFEVLERG